MNRNIVLVHGIHDNVKNWSAFERALRFRGFNVRLFAYPHRWAISYYLPWVRRNDGLRLANFVNDGDHVLAHSNGGNIVQAAIEYSWAEDPDDGVRFDKVFMFSAAATSDRMEYPDGSLDECFVVYNPRDNALKLGSILPWHCFGSLGLLGFIRTPSKARDRRFHNIQAYFTSGWFKPSHGFYFKDQIDRWIDFVVEKTSV
ncbi:hypothetical protein OAV22_02030 [Flavobacteriaceae bacterium]|nr:hypothetical protein [Flavobacteriaceae bacterium]